ncbi:ion transporter [Ophiostoma piceae UAMH 11346]|uniref:Ion transporter n=1 Tax=Ophiostoma piceae (strain UAMH 11346) TaxID=1262450 RepID=S3BSL8_OPHP1|nr:ion transporter [Ophiostoma piceae UAMH 11346]
MPLRVKSRPAQLADVRSPSPSLAGALRSDADVAHPLPDIGPDDSFRDVIKKLSVFMTEAVLLPSTFEQLRTTSAGDRLRALVTHLSITCDNPCIVNALLALKWHYGAASGDRGLFDARANACEIVAWRFLTHLSERDAVDFCLYEIPGTKRAPGGVSAASVAAIAPITPPNDEEAGSSVRSPTREARVVDENSPLLSQMWSSSSDVDRAGKRRTGAGSRRYQLLQSIGRLTMSMNGGHVHNDDSDDACDSDDDTENDDDDDEQDPTAPFVHLNALEIAAVADAKRFLSQNVVQKIITGIWNGDIVFWDRLEVDAIKKPRFYNPHTADPFARLRVPKYLKMFEALFFFVFLGIFYLTLLERNPTRVGVSEVFFFLFLAAFAYDELSEWIDAGSLFYVYDFWNVFDLIMIGIGSVFAVLRVVGLWRQDAYIIDLAFDILSLEALFMVPRISSILSLSPYWGTLIPCFKEMTKDFFKFMVLVVIIYLGFLTTFSLLGRALFTLPHMTMILTKIFFGSSYVGFDIMDDIDPVFGPPLMLVFVTLSSILLMGSLTGMLSNSFSRVMGHAREEYLYVYSIYVLEASTSNRLTHFYPPFNLLALVIFRPLRLFLPSNHKFRAARIALLKITHLPIVGTIQLYELVRGKIQDASGNYSDYSAMRGPRGRHTTPAVGNAGAIVTPKKTVIRPSLNHRQSASSFRHQSQHQRQQSSAVAPGQSRPTTSTSEYVPAPRPVLSREEPSSSSIAAAAAAEATEEDTGMDAPSDVEVRINELSNKIDRLTELILQMQLAQSSK